MDGQLSRKKVIGSPIYEESLERIFVEGIERFGIFQARKYLEHILNTVEKLENDYPYYPECRHLATKSRMFASSTAIQEPISHCTKILENWILMVTARCSIATKILSLPMEAKSYESIATVIIFQFKNFKEVFVCSK